jgi:hypothetical protein
MLRVGGLGAFGDSAIRGGSRECRVVGRTARRQPIGGARAELVDRGADHRVGQRHPLGGADDGHDAHALAPLRGGQGKNRLVRDW